LRPRRGRFPLKVDGPRPLEATAGCARLLRAWGEVDPDRTGERDGRPASPRKCVRPIMRALIGTEVEVTIEVRADPMRRGSQTRCRIVSETQPVFDPESRFEEH